MLKFEDVAMGIAFGKISKTVDGGKTWKDIYLGIGDEKKIFKTSSQIKFINETMAVYRVHQGGAWGHKTNYYRLKKWAEMLAGVIFPKESVKEAVWKEPCRSGGIILA